MPDPVFFIVDTLDYTDAIQGSGIAWLTATGGIEGSSVKGNGGPAADSFCLIDNASLELN